MEQKDLDVFLERSDLNEFETDLKNSVLETTKLIEQNMNERAQLNQMVKDKESEFFRLQGALTGYLKLVEKRLTKGTDEGVEL